MQYEEVNITSNPHLQPMCLLHSHAQRNAFTYPARTLAPRCSPRAVRKRNVFCSVCPRAVCEICAVKWVSEHGEDAFTGKAYVAPVVVWWNGFCI